MFDINRENGNFSQTFTFLSVPPSNVTGEMPVIKRSVADCGVCYCHKRRFVPCLKEVCLEALECMGKFVCNTDNKCNKC